MRHLLQLVVVAAAACLANASIGTCPASTTTIEADVDLDRAACTAACGEAGFCCTTNWGGCQSPTCTAGCLYAYFSATEAECVAQCGVTSGCEYAFQPSNDVTTHVTFYNCQGHEQCGCPARSHPSYSGSDWGAAGDCNGGCIVGCRLAANISGHSFYGRQLTPAEIAARSSTATAGETELAAVMSSLSAHVSGQAALSAAELAAVCANFTAHVTLLGNRGALITQALDMVDAFESSAYGPLFVSHTNIARGTPDVGDGRDIDRAMILVHQALIDHVYNRRGLLAPCSRSLFEGRAWQTASYFPGVATPPADPTTTHTVLIDTAHPATWGHPTGYSQQDAKKPTGLYLAPGQVATVTVPQALVDAGGYKVLVGAHDADNSAKSHHRRLDRITATYYVDATETVVANPLGGGLYILVPYLHGRGVVSVTISGGVVAAPFFQRTSFRTMSDADWLAVRTAPAPWADFETERFMLNVPSSWLSSYASRVHCPPFPQPCHPHGASGPPPISAVTATRRLCSTSTIRSWTLWPNASATRPPCASTRAYTHSTCSQIYTSSTPRTARAIPKSTSTSMAAPSRRTAATTTIGTCGVRPPGRSRTMSSGTRSSARNPSSSSVARRRPSSTFSGARPLLSPLCKRSGLISPFATAQSPIPR